MASAWFRDVCNWVTWARRAASAAVSPTPGVGGVPTVFCTSAMAASRVSFHFLPLSHCVPGDCVTINSLTPLTFCVGTLYSCISQAQSAAVALI